MEDTYFAEASGNWTYHLNDVVCLTCSATRKPKLSLYARNHEYFLKSLLAWMSALPGLIFQDDMHWADSLTWELLKCCPVDCCVVAAPVLLRLAELNPEEIGRLARSLLGGSAGGLPGCVALVNQGFLPPDVLRAGGSLAMGTGESGPA